MKKAIAFIFLIAVLLTGCVEGQAASSLPDAESIEGISSESESSSDTAGELVIRSEPDVPLTNDELLERFKSGDIADELFDVDYPDPEYLRGTAVAVREGLDLEWLQYDVNHDGLDDLVLQEGIPGEKSILGIFSAESGKIRCRYWDGNDLTEYCFVASNRNIIRYIYDFGTANHVNYYYYDYDADWNRRMVYCLVFYDIRDHESIDGWDEKHPDKNKDGNYYEKYTYQTAEDGTRIGNEEWITKEQFLELFFEMTGASFYDMIPSEIVLWDEAE